jgi:hypothetical protein
MKILGWLPGFLFIVLVVVGPVVWTVHQAVCCWTMGP